MEKDIVSRESTSAKQRNRLLRRIGQALLLLALCYCGYLWHLSYTGYSFKERRYLTDEELSANQKMAVSTQLIDLSSSHFGVFP